MSTRAFSMWIVAAASMCGACGPPVHYTRPTALATGDACVDSKRMTLGTASASAYGSSFSGPSFYVGDKRLSPSTAVALLAEKVPETAPLRDSFRAQLRELHGPKHRHDILVWGGGIGMVGGFALFMILRDDDPDFELKEGLPLGVFLVGSVMAIYGSYSASGWAAQKQYKIYREVFPGGDSASALAADAYNIGVAARCRQSP